MKKLVVLFLACVVATSAFAVIDPDPNSIGIYFDLNADTNCSDQSVSVPFMAYLILTNTTAPTVSAYEVGYLNVGPGPGQLFRLSSLIANGDMTGLDLGENGDPMMGDHIVGLSSPIPGNPATVLHSWNYMLLAQVGMEMYISAASQSSLEGPFPVILNANGNILFNAFHSTGGPPTPDGDPGIPVATVNGDCVVGTEAVSFGSVKSLFR
jgi:hypothetical protein